VSNNDRNTMRQRMSKSKFHLDWSFLTCIGTDKDFTLRLQIWTKYWRQKFSDEDLLLRTCSSHKPQDQGCTNFPKIYGPPQNSMCQKGDMKQSQYRRSTSAKHDHLKFSHHVDLALGTCTPLHKPITTAFTFRYSES